MVHFVCITFPGHSNISSFCISTLNPTIQSHLLAIVGAEYIMGYLPPGTHDYSKFLSPSLVKQKLQSLSLKEAAPPVGMVVKGLPPPLGPWQWELSDTDLNVNWIGVYQHAASSSE